MRPRSQLDNEILGLSQMVYNEIGQGMREKVYETALNRELLHNHKTIPQYSFSVNYKGECMSICYPDILLMYEDERILIEIKAVMNLGLKERQQLEGYIRHSGISVGYLINFGNRELEIIKYIGEEQINLTEEEF